MSANPPLRHLLEVDDLSAVELARILDLAELTDPPPEFDELGPQAGIVRLPHIAGHQVIGQPQRGRDSQ